MSASLTVSEIFGPTIQGEGRSVGKQAVFLRLGGCNLYCSWCDTAYTWRFSDTHPHQDNVVYDPKVELKRMDVQDIVDELEAKGLTDRRILVITGGEPLLQSTGIVALIKCLQRLSNWYGHIEIETNGTQMPLQTEPVYTNVYYNVSPKLANSGVKTIDRLNGLSLVAFSGLALRRFPREVIVKFVCRNDDDLKEIDDLLSIYRFPSDTIFVMPEGTDTATISNHTSQLVDKVIERGWNLTPRMHVDIWGKRRGV